MKTTSTDTIPFGRNVHLLKEDTNGLLALEKPTGTKSHPNTSDLKRGCLIRSPYKHDEQYYYWADESGNHHKLYLLNRLDAPTSGIILLTQSKELADIIKKQFKSKAVQKTYHAILKGQPNRIPKIWIDHLERKHDKKHLRAQKGGTSQAITEFSIIKKDANNLNLSLVKLHPKTGRTHQLRVQSALRKHPVIGDKTYGDFKLNRTLEKALGYKRLYLHATHLALEYQLNNKSFVFEVDSPLPESFNTLLAFNITLRKLRI